MELGTAIFYGALGTLAFVVGKFIGQGRFSIKRVRSNDILSKLGAEKGHGDIGEMLSLLKKLDGSKDDYKNPDETMDMDIDFTKRFVDMDNKANTLARAVTLYKRRSDDLWEDVRVKYKLRNANRLSVNEDYTKLKIFK